MIHFWLEAIRQELTQKHFKSDHLKSPNPGYCVVNWKSKFYGLSKWWPEILITLFLGSGFNFDSYSKYLKKKYKLLSNRQVLSCPLRIRRLMLSCVSLIYRSFPRGRQFRKKWYDYKIDDKMAQVGPSYCYSVNQKIVIVLIRK